MNTRKTMSGDNLTAVQEVLRNVLAARSHFSGHRNDGHYRFALLIMSGRLRSLLDELLEGRDP